MLAQITYRGPDDFQTWHDKPWALGAARLAIVDIRGGIQPMSSTDSRYYIAFNGEIFNAPELRTDLKALGHTFRTRSDTEVLLASLVQWNTGAMSRLEGQFAFAFLDSIQQRMILATDRFGERPLFYCALPSNGVAFASETKSLFALPNIRRAIDVQSLARTYAIWSPIPSDSVFQGIYAVPPGQLVEITHSHTTRRIWATPAIPGAEYSGEKSEAQDAIRVVLESSVARRLRSDVPIGCYLSGGLDSAIIASIAQNQTGRTLQTFSITFNDPDFDESPWQQTVAKHIGTEHHAVRISNRDISAVFPEVVYHAETPLFRSAPAPMYLLSRFVKESRIKVVLTGEGADEIFLGYDIFKETLFRRNFETFVNDDGRISALEGIYPHLSRFGKGHTHRLLAFYREHLRDDGYGLYSHKPRFSLGNLARRLLRPEGLEHDTTPRLSEWMTQIFPGFSKSGTMQQAQALELVCLLGGYLLSSQGDRMTAANGVEGRYPFTDHHVVQLALSIPENMRLSAGREKAILRDAFSDVLPANIIERPKNPYRSPDAIAFLHGPRVEWLDNLLKRAVDSEVLEPDRCLRLVDRLKALPKEQISPREDQAFMLMISTLLLEEQFVRNFVPVPTPA